MRGSGGFVLINALVLVLALSALAAGLLGLAATGRARIGEVRTADQIALYLDGAEALIPILLEREWEEDGTDHLDEFWATEDYTAPIGRGAVVANLSDLQGRLNLNELAPVEKRSRAEFERLFEILELDRTLLDALSDFMAEGGPSGAGLYRARAMPVLPRGGEMRVVEELRQVEGMTDAAYLRLEPFVSALPRGTPINANTAPAEVLRAGLAGLDTSGAAALIRERVREPFASALDFRVRAAARFGDDAFTEVPLERFSAGTSHFEAQLEVRLDGGEGKRKVRYVRHNDDDGRTERVLARAVPDFHAGPGTEMEFGQ